MSPHLPDLHVSRKRLSVELNELAEKAQDAELTLGGLMEQLEGRVYTLLLVLLSVPFCQPAPLPGLSTPLGLMITLLGLRFAFRQKPWLPQRLLATRVPQKFLPIVLRGSAKLLGWVEKLLHPRMIGMFDYRAVQFFAGLAIFISGALLLLPLPIPFSNMLPALTVVLIASSFSERDGAMLWAGWAMFLITLAFFVALFLGGAEAIQWVEANFSGYFDPNDEAPGVAPLE